MNPFRLTYPLHLTTHYDCTPDGAIQLLRELSSYDIAGATAHRPIPEDSSYWEVTGPKMPRVVVFMAGYRDQGGNLQKFNEFVPAGAILG